MKKGRINGPFLGHTECNCSENCSPPRRKWINARTVLFISRQTSETIFAWKQTKPGHCHVVLLVLGLRQNLLQLSLRSRDGVLPRCWGHHLSLYNLSVLFSTNRKSQKTAEDLARTRLLRQAHRGGLMGLLLTDSRWCGCI